MDVYSDDDDEHDDGGGGGYDDAILMMATSLLILVTRYIWFETDGCFYTKLESHWFGCVVCG